MMEALRLGGSYLTGAVTVVFIIGAVLSLLFPIYQNKNGRLGGAISIWKSIWLIYAIVLWLVLPWFFVGFNDWWFLLGGSMLLRGLVEIPLCYTKKWKVSYGVTHDVIHLFLVVPLFFVIGSEGQVWLWLTLISLLVEIVFVYCFRLTCGNPAEGVYFVPQGTQFKWLNQLTAFLLVPQLAVIGWMLWIKN
jgi:hypothetical protein